MSLQTSRVTRTFQWSSHSSLATRTQLYLNSMLYNSGDLPACTNFSALIFIIIIIIRLLFGLNATLFIYSCD